MVVAIMIVFMARKQPQARRIGLAFDFQVVDRLALTGR